MKNVFFARKYGFFSIFLLLLLWTAFFVYPSTLAKAQNTISVESATVVDGMTTVCTVNNIKKGALRIIKQSVGIPASFYYQVFPTPTAFKVTANIPSGKPNAYRGQQEKLLDEDKYKVTELVPSDRWIMRSASCKILEACGDGICDTNEKCDTCSKDCGQCPPPPGSLTPPSAEEEEETPPDPTGTPIPGKTALDDVEVKLGHTTECIFKNEFLTLKIIATAIGGDGTEKFTYTVKGFDVFSPSQGTSIISVPTNVLNRSDKTRGDEYTGSNGKYINPGLTSYRVIEDIPDEWVLNSASCKFESGTPFPQTYQTIGGLFNVTVRDKETTTCEFKNTKKGSVMIKKEADTKNKDIKGDEEFTYNFKSIGQAGYFGPYKFQYGLFPLSATVQVNDQISPFVTVADSGDGNRIMTSPDGVTWTIRESPKDEDGNFIDIDWQSITYGKGLFVAVASSGDKKRIMTSPNGVDWTIRDSPKDKNGNPIDKDWQSVAYGNPFFVAVANGDTAKEAMSSEDGINWYMRNTPEDNAWNSVAYGGGRYVAVAGTGEKEQVMTSTDGVVWSVGQRPKNEKGKLIQNNWQSVTFGDGLFVAVSDSGEGNRVMTSDDGLSWVVGKTPEDHDWKSVTYGKNVFVAVASSGEIMVSKDGFEWEIKSGPSSNWENVIYAKNLFVAVASGGGTSIMTSVDGQTWTARQSPKDDAGNSVDNDWQSTAYHALNFYPGIYNAEEILPASDIKNKIWSLLKFKCTLENGDPTGNMNGKTMENIEVYAGKTTTCTVKNGLTAVPEGGAGNAGKSGVEQKKKEK